jgi:hypothetical protein
LQYLASFAFASPVSSDLDESDETGWERVGVPEAAESDIIIELSALPTPLLRQVFT